jgi:purine-binding chemotaxis protein CheW
MSDQPMTNQPAHVEFVSLTAGDQGFCIPITRIREIRRWTQVTALPHADAAVLGVMNLRGAVIPIIDLAARLGIGASSNGQRSVIVVVTVGTRVMGLLVESVSEILTTTSDSIRPNPMPRKDSTANSIVGLLSFEDTMLRVLDLDSLFGQMRVDAA